MTIETWGALVAALIILGLSPGPAWAAVITTSLGCGFVAAAVLSVGIALGDVVFLLIAALGLSVLAQMLGTFFLGLKFIGAACLIWLGIKLWRDRPASHDAAMPLSRHLVRLFAGGLMLTLGNPKVIAFYLGFLPAFVDLPSLKATDLALLAATTFLVIAGMLCGYASLAARAQALFVQEKAHRFLGRVTGSCLIGTGVLVATR